MVSNLYLFQRYSIEKNRPKYGNWSNNFLNLKMMNSVDDSDFLKKFSNFKGDSSLTWTGNEIVKYCLFCPEIISKMLIKKPFFQVIYWSEPIAYNELLSRNCDLKNFYHLSFLNYHCFFYKKYSLIEFSHTISILDHALYGVWKIKNP